MAILKKNAFSRRVPDLVTEELVAVLSRRASFEFKQLFDIVHENADSPHVSSVNSFERQMTLKEPGEGISENFEYPACPLCGSDRCEFPFRLRLEGDY